MPRDLTPDERALWRRVTADVRKARAAIADVVSQHSPSGQEKRSPLPVAAKPAALVKPPVQPQPRSSKGTLDGRWDRLLGGGQIVPDRVIDLHGCTLDQAHRRAIDAVVEACRQGDRVLVLVTGKAPPRGTSRIDMPLRGIIRASMGDWLAASPVASRIAAVRPAHPRHGGAGAIYVILRRPRR